ncbi:MAG TPA: hypothetical protein VM802_14555 [Chitinophaga sp.]|uniref:hypothetical protein n=1 Tax=Chitinophaga sp. TaxID=1869181 RepID=UPI002C9CA643|nr:hypothetical protein [Chitinophaga sp.]HVI46094.1 hypothetical protein [Chitinophaga sp.]
MLSFASEYYHNAASGDTIRFFQDGNEHGMEWKGAGWEKLGTWNVTHTYGKTFLEFTYNYAREERYIFTSLESQSGKVVAFRLEDSLNRSWDFRAIR